MTRARSRIVLNAPKAPVDDETDEDLRLAREALAFIARLERRATLELVIEVGDYLIKVFYGGNLELALSRNPLKARALGMLEDMAPELEIPASRLRYAVGMSVQYRELPAQLRDRLSARQHRALLPVKDARVRTRLARKAVDEKLAGDKLSTLVRSELGTAKLGRKPMAEVERAVAGARRLLGAATLEADTAKGRLRALPADTRERIRRDAVVVRERIEKILDGLG